TEAYSYQWFPEAFTPDGPSVEAADLAAATRTLVAFMDEAIAAHAADAARTCILGFSQGGTLALATLLARPDLVRAVVSISGWLPDTALDAAAPEENLQGRAVLVIHGR